MCGARIDVLARRHAAAHVHVAFVQGAAAIEPVEVRSVQHAVAIGAREHHPRRWAPPPRAEDVLHRAARLGPSADARIAVTNIERQQYLPLVCLTDLTRELWVAHREAAEHDERGTLRQPPPGVLRCAHAATNLHRAAVLACCPHRTTHRHLGARVGPAAGRVQIDDVHAARAGRDEIPRHPHRLRAVHRLAGVIPLAKPHAPAPAHVDRRNDDHAGSAAEPVDARVQSRTQLAYTRSPAAPLVSGWRWVPYALPRLPQWPTA